MCEFAALRYFELDDAGDDIGSHVRWHSQRGCPARDIGVGSMNRLPACLTLCHKTAMLTQAPAWARISGRPRRRRGTDGCKRAPAFLRTDAADWLQTEQRAERFLPRLDVSTSRLGSCIRSGDCRGQAIAKSGFGSVRMVQRAHASLWDLDVRAVIGYLLEGRCRLEARR